MFRTRFLLILGTITSLLILLHSCNFINHEPNLSKTASLNKTSSSSTNIFTKIRSNIYPNGKILTRNNKSQIQNVSTTEEQNIDEMVFKDLPYQYDLQKSELLTDIGKLLAGMQISDRSKLASLKNTNIWLNHYQIMTNSWKNLEEEQLSEIKQWQKTTIKELERLNSKVFYPFSNFNFIYAYSFFPKTQEFILFGLDPIGSLPDLPNITQKKLEVELDTVRNSLMTIFPKNYFNSNEEQNIQTQFALPILSVFLARSHNRIINIENIGINNEGKLEAFHPAMIPGVKITFMMYGESTPRTLYYFSADLSNESLDKYPEISKYLSRQNNLFTYLNTASYLMHFDSYSQIKELILSQSNYILQDDSGLPINAFKDDSWKLDFYGNYVRPVSLFEDKYQPQLWQIYQSQKNIKPLNFTMGYQQDYENSNLMLAKQK